MLFTHKVSLVYEESDMSKAIEYINSEWDLHLVKIKKMSCASKMISGLDKDKDYYRVVVEVCELREDASWRKYTKNFKPENA